MTFEHTYSVGRAVSACDKRSGIVIEMILFRMHVGLAAHQMDEF